MTKRSRKQHIKQLCSHFELACMFGAWICAIDLFWLSHDIAANGLNFHYIVVGLGLLIGLSGTLYALTMHHKETFKKYRKTLLRVKAKASKHKRSTKKANRRSNKRGK